MDENERKNQRVMDLDEKTFRNFLEEGQVWCREQGVVWAKVKTLDISKDLILFNLGILAFIGAANDKFASSKILILSVGSASFSILLSFWFLWIVTNANIKLAHQKYMIIGDGLRGLQNKEDKTFHNYESDMKALLAKSEVEEKCWSKIQLGSIFFFLLGVAFTIGGLVVK